MKKHHGGHKRGSTHSIHHGNAHVPSLGHKDGHADPAFHAANKKHSIGTPAFHHGPEDNATAYDEGDTHLGQNEECE